MLVQEPVQAAIWHCLNHYDHKNAVFLAELLCCEVETDETIFLLATSYYRSNLIHQAYGLLKEKAPRSPQCRYLRAKCAFHLKKYSEAESTLCNNYFGDVNYFDEIVKDFGETACFVLQLIAKICMKTERNKIAAEALRKALKLNPFMWQAFADLCHLGEQADVNSIFQISSTDIFKTCQGNVNSNSMVLFESTGVLSDTELLIRQNNVPLTNLSSTVPNTDGVLSNFNNSPSYTPSTPVEQQNVTQINTVPTQSAATPNNVPISILLFNTTGEPAIATHSSTAMTLSDTPKENTGISSAHILESGSETPFRRQFKYLSALSPMTPSFGVMPLSSPYTVDSPIGNTCTANAQTTLNITKSPLPQSLATVNLEHKAAAKKVKSQVNRLTASSSNSSPNKPAVFTQTGNITARTAAIPANATAGASVPNAAVRRSSRLFSNNAYSVKENNKSANIAGTKFVQPRSPSRKTKSRMAKIGLNNEMVEDKSIANADKLNETNLKKDAEKIETVTSMTGNSCFIEDTKVLLNNNFNNAQTIMHHVLTLKQQSAEGLMALLRDLGQGYKHLAHYQCKSAIKLLETSIPKHHLCSSWVQSLIGMSHYELREYESAVSIFKRIHEIEPYRMDYMEIYSSSLWHLQKEVDLSALAQDLVNQDKTSPITWCAAGNCFSLHKEHETAIKFFKRAVQVDPDFVYSYTLLGHELVLTEELDKALDVFRAAVVRDPRHYNAWFGIGTIYSKQERYELAELHYIKSLKINPQNSVILVHIGAMQYFRQRKEQALQTLNTAALLDPKNPLARFHRGSIYFSLGKHQEALRELEELKEIVPKESVVFYLIGKIHKTLGNVDLALMHFSWATDLDPKGANNQIKDAFDSVSPNCPTISEPGLDVDLEPISERSDDSTQAHDVNYDSDGY